jgi:hypothetical protein
VGLIACRFAHAAWQHPFVNVFKLCDVEHWKDVERQGEVKAQMVGSAVCCLPRRAAWSPGERPPPPRPLHPPARQDRTIGKTVLHVSGSIPAINYVKLPKGRAGLNLSGRFLYMQVGSR